MSVATVMFYKITVTCLIYIHPVKGGLPKWLNLDPIKFAKLAFLMLWHTQSEWGAWVHVGMFVPIQGVHLSKGLVFKSPIILEMFVWDYTELDQLEDESNTTFPINGNN